MAAARKRVFNGHSRPSESRRKAIAAIQICWQKMRPDLAFDKDQSREERLSWVAGFLGLKSLDSLTGLSDAQLGSVAGEMKRLTGVRNDSANPKSQIPNPKSAEIYHFASEEQVYVLERLQEHLGWTDQGVEDYLLKRFNRRTFRTLGFKHASAATIQLLNIAAHRDLKQANPEAKISRKDTGKYIPVLKKTLGIDQ